MRCKMDNTSPVCNRLFALGLDLITLSTASSRLFATSAAASSKLIPLVSCLLFVGGNLNLVVVGDFRSLLTLITLSIESGEDTQLESLSLSSVSGLNSSRVSNLGRGLATASTFPLDTDDCLTMGNDDLLVLVPNPGFCLSSSLIFFSLSFLVSATSTGDFSGLAGVVFKLGVFKLVFLNFGICCTEYFCASVLLGSLVVLSVMMWSLPDLSAKFSVDGFGELSCLVRGYTVNGICLILGLVGQEDCLILGEFGTEAVFKRGDVGPGDRFVGDIGSDLGTKITEAKESSESTLVSL